MFISKETLRLAGKDWPWADHQPLGEVVTGDCLIALAVGCIRQRTYETAGLTKEDAAIMQRRAPLCAYNADGKIISMSNDIVTLRYLCSLND